MLPPDPLQKPPDGRVGPLRPVVEQVLAYEEHDGIALGAREAQPREQFLRDLGPDLRVAVERSLAVILLVACRRLAEIVAQGRPTHAKALLGFAQGLERV